jgi:modulator of FtsH protease
VVTSVVTPRPVLSGQTSVVTLALDPFRPAEWHDFFVMVGGAAAVLTGLVFVAMSLNVSAIAQDATHRYRAIGTLTGMTAAFVISALALLGDQDHVSLGLEWAVVATLAVAVYMFGYVQSVRLGGSAGARRVSRVVINGAFYLAQLAGAVVLAAGSTSGLYVAAVAMVGQVAFMITGAWLLIVGVPTASPEPASTGPDASR